MSSSTESLQNQPETNPNATATQFNATATQPNATAFKNPQNYQKPSELDLLADAWKHKETVWKHVSTVKLLSVGIPSLVGLIGFGLKSKALRRAMVKRFMVQTKHFNLSDTTTLNFIPRPTIFQEWDKIVNYESSSQKMLLIEGYQGTGKSFLVQKFIEEQSKVRPTLYISLRDINLIEARQIIGKQINFYAESFPAAGGII